MVRAQLMDKPSFNISFVDDKKDAAVIEFFLCDIFESVRNRVLAAYRAELPAIMKTHPRTLVNMIAANVVVNMVHGAFIPDTTSQMRLEAMEETIEELSQIIRFVWRTFETMLAPEDNIQ